MAKKTIEESSDLELLEELVNRVTAMPDLTGKGANIATNKAMCGQAFVTLSVQFKQLELLT